LFDSGLNTVKGEIAAVHTMQACKRSGRVAPVILNSVLYPPGGGDVRYSVCRGLGAP
jgi:hypothetical protein